MPEAAPPPAADQPDLSGVPGPGESIADKYVVERLIGVGGMGAVVAARHAQIGQRVAIKILLPAAARHPESMARFLQEARAASAIESDHVARVLDVGSMPSGIPFMVMELLVGQDLSELIDAGPRQPTEAVDYVIQACEALAQAHALGVVHRDLKPSNLFVTRRSDGSALLKVLDFGISKVVGEGPRANLTATTLSFGTPTYMSPEQIRSAKRVDPRTDIWALGVILYESLAKEIPFEADTIPGLCAAISIDPPKPLQVTGVSAELAAVVHRCLEKDPTRRFQNMGELAAALAPFASPTMQALVPRVLAIASAGSPATLPDLGLDPNHPGASGAWQAIDDQPSHRRLVAVTAAATLAVGLLGAFAVAKLTAPPPVVVAVASAPTPPPSSVGPSRPTRVDADARPSASAVASASASASAPPAPSSSTSKAVARPTGRNNMDEVLGERR